MIFLGLDIGTTNTKAALLAATGELLGCLTLSPRPGQRPTAATWYDHFGRVMDHFRAERLLTGQQIACSITAQGGTFVLLDHKFHPVSRVYSWAEKADEQIVRDMDETFARHRYYHTTGWVPNRWMTVCKVKQLCRQNQIPKDCRFFSAVPEYIYAQLTGTFVTDITNAQITGMCDFEKRRWDPQIAAWLHLDEQNLPTIVTECQLLPDEVSTPWGKMVFTTSSHDQYAAMQAADLLPDKSVMLGTGTAWVINSRSRKPVFDDTHYLTHPGRDLHNNCYGNIIGLGPIGAGFDTLREKAGFTQTHLAEMETDFEKENFPEAPVRMDVPSEHIDRTGNVKTAIRRYMEGAAAAAAFVLEKFGLSANCDQIIMSGGAAGSRFWPQVLADVCDQAVQVVNFPEFTAYGAALHAQCALQGPTAAHRVPPGDKTRTYEPVHAPVYRQWYHEHQKPIMEKLLLG